MGLRASSKSWSQDAVEEALTQGPRASSNCSATPPEKQPGNSARKPTHWSTPAYRQAQSNPASWQGARLHLRPMLGPPVGWDRGIPTLKSPSGCPSGQPEVRISRPRLSLVSNPHTAFDISKIAFFEFSSFRVLLQFFEDGNTLEIKSAYTRTSTTTITGATPVISLTTNH